MKKLLNEVALALVLAFLCILVFLAARMFDETPANLEREAYCIARDAKQLSALAEAAHMGGTPEKRDYTYAMERFRERLAAYDAMRRRVRAQVDALPDFRTEFELTREDPLLPIPLPPPGPVPPAGIVPGAPALPQ